MTEATIKKYINDACLSLDDGVKNAEDCKVAIVRYFGLLKAFESVKSTLHLLTENGADLFKEICRYADTHEGFFDEPRTEVRDGQFTGVVTIDGVVYRFTKTMNNIKRADESAMTQTFLANLPEDWVTQKLAFDTINVKRLNLDQSVLEEHGLTYYPRFTLSEVEKGGAL